MEDKWEAAEIEFQAWIQKGEHELSTLEAEILSALYLSNLERKLRRIKAWLKPKSRQVSLEEESRLLIREVSLPYGKPVIDEDLCRELYEDCFPKIISHIKANSGNKADAEDIFQQALLVLICKYSSFKISGYNELNGLVFGISKKLWLQRLAEINRSKASAEAINADLFYLPGKSEQPDIYQELKQARSKLGTACKNLLDLYYFEKLSWEEISFKLGYKNAASAKNQKYKCLNKLRNELGGLRQKAG